MIKFHLPCALSLAALLFPASAAFAQKAIEIDAVKAAVEGTTPPQGVVIEGVVPPGQPGALPIGPDGKPLRPNGSDKPADGAKGEEKVKTTLRPTKPDAPANPDELKIRPDENGRVRFNFHGQPWLGVLEWLARVSDLSLDWQELPADFLNLRTQRSYSLDEAHDLINRHLLERGFTLVKHGEILSAVNVKKLDPSIVPRVAPDALDERQPHEFVKVSFPLDALTAEAAVEELKPMLSPNGKLFPLKTTNRIEAIDAAINLVEIRDMLSHEQSHRGRKRIVREFRLDYARANDVANHVRELLGMEKKADNHGAAAPQNPREQMMLQQQMMMEQQMQQQQGGGQAGGPKPPRAASQVHLIVNIRENSLVAQGPADQMAIVAEAVKILDVPSSNSQSLAQNINRTQVYRLATIDPEPFVKMLEETAELDPATRLQIDKRSRAVIVRAPLADHMTIRALVKKLDGTDRKFEVIKLRRLEADYVAGSIEFMMGAGEKKKQQNNRYYPFFDMYNFGGGNGQQEDESRKFRVDADTEHNRLLLWANSVELEEIHHLLVKLGEISDPNGNPSTWRVLDTIPPEEAEELLQKLQKSWKNVAPNRLEYSPDAPPKSNQPQQRTAPKRKDPSPVLPADEDDLTDSVNPAAVERGLAWMNKAKHHDKDLAIADQEIGQKKPAPASEDDPLEVDPPLTDSAHKTTEENQPPTRNRQRNVVTAPRRSLVDVDATNSDEPAPVHIGRGADGKVIISSADSVALDLFEDLVAELSQSERRDFKVFRLKYRTTWAYDVALGLKEFFDDKEKNNRPRSRWDYIYGPMMNDQTPDEKRLSKRRPLKFISNSDSNSIIVVGADPNQLRTIEELISTWDIPESKDSAVRRKSQLIEIKYSKARAVADAIKDVYRDLLSINDPAMQQNQNQQKKSNDSTFTYINNYGSDDKKPDGPAKFKGQLSIGVVEWSNSIYVSAAEGQFNEVVSAIRSLDKAAIPALNRMRVVKVNRTVDANELQKRLKNLVTKPPQPKQPQQGMPQQQMQMQNPDSTTIIDNN